METETIGTFELNCDYREKGPEYRLCIETRGDSLEKANKNLKDSIKSMNAAIWGGKFDELLLRRDK